MSLKLDTKLMKVADEFADFDLLKPKNRPSPHFRSQETDSMFILTMQLKGYTRTNINVEINEDESIISISGEKSVQDMLMVGGKVVKKDIEKMGFRKSFKVPRVVVMDKVNARFDQDVSELIIQMPKATKGLTWIGIEEMKTKENKTEFTKQLQVYTDEELLENENQKKEKEKERNQDEEKLPRKRFKICTPVIFGSAFFMSLIVLVFHLVQSGKQEKTVEKQKKRKQE